MVAVVVVVAVVVAVFVVVVVGGVVSVVLSPKRTNRPTGGHKTGNFLARILGNGLP